MNFRKHLLKAGVKPRDLREAVESARLVTQHTELYSSMAEDILTRIAEHPRAGKKIRAIFVVAAKTAATMKMAAGEMLKKGTK